MASAFDGWVWRVGEKKRMHRMAMHVVQVWQHRGLFAAVSTWRLAATARVRKRLVQQATLSEAELREAQLRMADARKRLAAEEQLVQESFEKVAKTTRLMEAEAQMRTTLEEQASVDAELRRGLQDAVRAFQEDAVSSFSVMRRALLIIGQPPEPSATAEDLAAAIVAADIDPRLARSDPIVVNALQLAQRIAGSGDFRSPRGTRGGGGDDPDSDDSFVTTVDHTPGPPTATVLRELDDLRQ